MTLFPKALLVAATLGLAGCSAISSLTDVTTPLQAYQLRAPTELPEARGRLGRELAIEAPTTGGALDTDRIMIRPDPLQAQYLPDARWTDTAPVMLQSLMVRTFEDTNTLRYVGRRPLGGSGDYVLVSELTDFQAELGPDGETVTTRVRLVARLVRESDSSILGSRTITTAAAAASSDTADVIDSFDRATSGALRDLVGWALGAMGLRVSG